MFGLTRKPTHSASSDAAAYIQLAELIAQRRPAQQLPLASWRKLLGPQGEQHPSRLRGRGMELAEIRHYQPGDDIRTIDWNITARSQKPHTKIFQEERERPVLLLVDQSPPMFFGSRNECKSVTAARAAALVGWAALHNRDQVGGLVYGEREYAFIKPRRSRRALLYLLGELQRFNHALRYPAAPQPGRLAQMLTRLQPALHPGCLLFIISDFLTLDDAALQRLYRVSRHNDVIGVYVHDPLEHTLPSAACLPLTDGHRTLTLSALNTAQRQAYTERFQRQLAFVRHSLQRYGIPLITLGTHEAPLARLQAGLGLPMHPRGAS